jgi:hypothetical protein
MEWTTRTPTELGTYWRKLGNQLQLVALLGRIDDRRDTWLAVPTEDGEYDLLNPAHVKGEFKSAQTNDDLCMHILGLTGHRGLALGLVYFEGEGIENKGA